MLIKVSGDVYPWKLAAACSSAAASHACNISLRRTGKYASCEGARTGRVDTPHPQT